MKSNEQVDALALNKNKTKGNINTDSAKCIDRIAGLVNVLFFFFCFLSNTEK